MTTYVKVTPTEYLRQDAAESLQRAVTHGGFPLVITDGLRSLDEQEDLFFANYTSNYAISSKLDRRPYKGKNYWRRSPYYSHVAVAIPGTSKHGTGTAVDVPETQRAWFRKSGAFYGWFNPKWAQDPKTFEPWHWEYDPTKDQSKKYWSDMPSLVKHSASKDQTVVSGKWNTVKINDSGDVSLVIGAKAFDADVWVRLTGVSEAATVQGRLYKVEYNDKTKKSKRVYTYPDSLTEFKGTAGSTFFRFGVKGGCENGSERLRAEIQVFDNGNSTVKIIDAGTRSHIW